MRSAIMRLVNSLTWQPRSADTPVQLIATCRQAKRCDVWNYPRVPDPNQHPEPRRPAAMRAFLLGPTGLVGSPVGVGAAPIMDAAHVLHGCSSSWVQLITRAFRAGLHPCSIIETAPTSLATPRPTERSDTQIGPDQRAPAPCSRVSRHCWRAMKRGNT